MDKLHEIRKELESLSSVEKSKASARFFKTGPGQYGEGDIFIGVTIPEQRKIAYRYKDLTIVDLEQLLRSNIHEERSLALIILVKQFERGDASQKELIYNFYISHTKYINNWDLVDSSAEYIVGAFLENRDKSLLRKLAKSEIIWERRIAILSTFHYIKQGNSTETLQIATLLLNDQHDLIQKAVGWMLREVGKRCSLTTEKEFLLNHYKKMPRTTLRYAIERFPENIRKKYLKNLI